MKGQNTLKMKFLFNNPYLSLLIHFPLKMIFMWKNQKLLQKNFPQFMHNLPGKKEMGASVKGKFPVKQHVTVGEQDKLPTITHATINSAQNSAKFFEI
jgi:hypothetical protein